MRSDARAASRPSSGHLTIRCVDPTAEALNCLERVDLAPGSGQACETAARTWSSISFSPLLTCAAPNPRNRPPWRRWRRLAPRRPATGRTPPSLRGSPELPQSPGRRSARPAPAHHSARSPPTRAGTPVAGSGSAGPPPECRGPPSVTSCSRLEGFVADFTVAIDSFAASIGPLGSAREMARPATNGARTIRRHCSSEKSFLVVTVGPFVGGWRVGGPARPRALVAVSRVAPNIVTVRLVRQDRRPCRRSKISAGLPSRTRGRAHSRSLITNLLVTQVPT